MGRFGRGRESGLKRQRILSLDAKPEAGIVGQIGMSFVLL